MIEESIKQLADNFSKSWTKKLKKVPRFSLDYTWPSVGTLDLITYQLRRKDVYTRKERDIIRSASAYLACIAHDCWSQFPGNPTVEVQNTSGVEFDIIITATGGDLLAAEESFSVNVVQSLKLVLEYKGDALSFFGRKLRAVPLNYNLLSLFGIGLITGYTPFGIGPWKDDDEKDYVRNLIQAQEYLAKTCASYYNKHFPDEDIGKDENLYHYFLILPPSQIEEHFPGCRAVTGIIQYFKDNDIPLDRLTTLSNNLALSPDDLISTAGFALSCALCNETQDPSNKLIALSQSKGSYAAKIRPAVMTARKALGHIADISECIEKGDFDTAITLAEIEKKLNLIPLLRCSTRHFKNTAFKPFINALLWFAPKEARDEIDLLEKQGAALEPDIILQAIFLDIMMGNLDKARDELDFFENLLEGNPLQEKFLFLELKGLYEAFQGDLKNACKYLQMSLEENIKDAAQWERIATELARFYVLDFKHEEGLMLINEIVKKNPYTITARVYRALSYEEGGQDKELRKEIEALAKFAGNDRRVFGLLIK
jgi:hypothetical protein